MKAFAPEFAQYWLSSPSADAVEVRRDADDERDERNGGDQAALEALAERVTAARSIV